MPTVTITASSIANAYENGTDGTFRITRATDASLPAQTVYYTVGGSATADTDYTALSGSVDFDADQTTADIDVAAINNDTADGNRTVTLTVSGSPTATMNIWDDEPPVVSVAAVANAVEGSTNGAFQITRSGGDLTTDLVVYFTFSGTATSGTDYTSATWVTFGANATTATVYITGTADNLVEGDETVVLTISDGFGSYSGGGEDSSILVDDPPTISVYTLTNAAEIGDVGTFQLTRTGGDVTAALTVNFGVTGTATSGTNYSSIGTSVTFAANSSTATVTVTAIDDNIEDADETVILGIVTAESGATYVASGANTATMHITDSTAATFTLSDSNSGTMEYNIPWGDVDNTEATQSLSLSNFAITVAGQTLTESNADFTTSPTVQFAYGVITGISFAIDTSTLSGYSYSAISVSGSSISATATGTSDTVTGDAASTGWIWIDYGYFRDRSWGTGTFAHADTVYVTITTNLHSYSIEVPIPIYTSREDAALLTEQKLIDYGFITSGRGQTVSFKGPAPDGQPITGYSITHTNTQNGDPRIFIPGP